MNVIIHTQINHSDHQEGNESSFPRQDERHKTLRRQSSGGGNVESSSSCVRKAAAFRQFLTRSKPKQRFSMIPKLWFTIGCLVGLLHTATALVHERNLLEEFYNATGGPVTWINRTLWGTFEPICDWHGVQCRAESVEAIDEGRVVGLSLPHNGLVHELPVHTTLSRLPSLEHLDLTGNRLTGVVDFTGAARLQEFSCVGCFLTELKNLPPSLRRLYVARNQLTDLPNNLHELLDLEELQYSQNALSSVRLDQIVREGGLQLPSLQSFQLVACQLSGPLPNMAHLSVQLKVVALSDNDFDGTLDAALGTDEKQYDNALPHLNTLLLANNQFRGLLPALANYPSLTQVSLAHNQLTGRIPSNFLAAVAASADQPALQVNLQDNVLTGTVPVELAEFQQLAIQLTGNMELRPPLAPEFCQMDQWMNGLVGLYGCDAILCPRGTSNRVGHQVSAAEPCELCGGGMTGSNQDFEVDTDDEDGDDVLEYNVWLPRMGMNDCRLYLKNDTAAAHAWIGPALAQLYWATDGPHWHNQDGWELIPQYREQGLDYASLSYCSFFGIVCHPNQADQVELIGLANNGLLGTVPESLWTVPGLQAVDMSYNRITVELGAAPDLRRLRLTHTNQDTIQGLQSMTKLRELFLEGCQLKTLDPSSGDSESVLPAKSIWKQLSNLGSLHLQANQIDGPIPTELGHLTNLKTLLLNENEFTGALPTEIGQCTNLQSLDISDNGALQGSLPLEWNNLKQIKTLRLNRAGLIGPLPSFHDLTKLEEMELSSNSLTGDFPAHFLSQRVQLAPMLPLTLRLSSNEISGTLPTSLLDLVDVIIELEDNLITGMDEGFCFKTSWMDGEVGKLRSVQGNGCHAILCPKQTWNPSGRVVSGNTASEVCQACAGNDYFGETVCETQVTSNPEVEILDKLFEETGGRYWNETHVNWTKPGVPLCFREGVFCGWPTPGMNSGVTELRLNGYGLRGKIPTEVYQLPRLRLLSVSFNEVDLSFRGIERASELVILKLTDTNVKTLRGFQRAGKLLSEFHIATNALTGTFPTELLKVTTLKGLFIGENRFSGRIPTEIDRLSNLAKLSIHDNDFTGPLPTQIGNLKQLKVLDAHDCQLSGLLPRELEQLEQLQRLSLSNQRSESRFQGPLLPFSRNPFLKDIYLNRNNLNGEIPTNLLHLVDLDASIRLDLSFNQLSGGLPIELQNYTHMTLDVVQNELTELPPQLCDNLDWMEGVVRRVPRENRCDAILCKPGTASVYGRMMKPIGGQEVRCEECPVADQAPYYGSTACLNRRNRRDREILMDFYRATDGGAEQWIVDDAWMSESHVCSWHGVECDGKLQVVGLSLENNGLTLAQSDSDLMKTLSGLENLKKLDLKGNALPLNLAGVQKKWGLEILAVSETKLSSLDGIGRLSSLESLLAADNDLTGLIPTALYGLTKLRQIYLSYNHLTGSISTEIGMLTDLRQLYIAANDLSGQLPIELGALTRLQELQLQENKLSGAIPAPLSNMTLLEQLHLQAQRGNDLIDGNLPDFYGAKNLWYLDVSYNDLSGPIPPALLAESDRVNQTVSIFLRNNDLSGAVPEELKRFEALNLELGGNNIEVLPPVLCTRKKWMNGDVGKLGTCDAILCPSGTYSSTGRKTSNSDECVPCDGYVKSPFLGHTYCQEIQSERGVLEVLYSKCDGTNWKRRSRWFQTDPICSWDGVSCDGDVDDDVGVLKIELEANGLKCTLPSQLWSLPLLQELDFTNNEELYVNFSTSSPRESLQHLSLAGVNFVDGLAGVSLFPSLRSLGMTKLSGVLPRELFELSHLQILNISQADFIGTLPTEIGLLTSLQKLHAVNNDFHGPLNTHLSRLSYLEELVLDENLLSGKLPDFLSSMQYLQKLSISRKGKPGRKLMGPMPSFSNNPQLMELNLEDNDISGTLSDKFLQTSLNLRVAELRGNQLSGSVPKSLNYLEGISLNLQDNRISELSDDFCDNEDWMHGEVGELGCDAIMCPPATTSPFGRADDKEGEACESCPFPASSKFYGSTVCAEPIDERSILIKLFRDTSGEDWVRGDFWGTKTNVCNWYGIACDENGHVILLNLQQNGLKGSIPAELFRLPRLQFLDLGSNHVWVTLQDIGHAKNLLDLRLQGAGDVNVTGVGRAPALTYLDVGSNGIRGLFPETIMELKELRVLKMSNNQMNGDLPLDWSPLKKLRVLELERNGFVGSLPAFAESPLLYKVNLGRNRLQGTIPADIFWHVPRSKMISLDASENALDGDVPSALGRFDSLTLNLAGNRIESLPTALCEKEDWNSMNVGLYGCDAILCPPGTWNEEGKRRGPMTCAPCSFEGDLRNKYGQTRCPHVATSGFRHDSMGIGCILSVMTLCSLIFL